MGVLLFAAERRLEIAQALSKRPPDFRQALGPEHEQRDHENEQKMCWLKNVADHSRTSLAGAGCRVVLALRLLSHLTCSWTLRDGP